MSKEVDERVVSMQFDNKQFENNVRTSMSTIDKLKQKLNFEGASKGLENINSSAKNINMSGLSGAVEAVHAKFSALEVMGVTALANITNSAVNAGKRIVSALTIDPIKTGFNEYETQINAVQTILANTSHAGTNIDDVNKALDKLNLYADKTIYNFTEMTHNIGTFTAAGLGLEESTTAIKGIANLAAVSGSTSAQASTAMYQLSQALANGTVNLQDWNSVVNAGMGGKVFQDALVRTAAAMKGVSEETFRAENITGSFRESISTKDGTGWLTSDILSKTLQQFAGDLSDAELAAMGFSETQITEIQKMAQTANDAATKVKTFTQLWDTLKESAQSGWSQSWEIIVGDFEEAKSLLTQVSDTLGGFIGKSAEARNKVLQDWKDLGGRTAIIDAIKNAFEGLISIVKPIKEAFRSVFPPITGKQLADLSKKIKDITSNFKLSKERSDQLKTAFKGLFSIIDIVRMGFVGIYNALKPVFNLIKYLAGRVLELSSAFGEWSINLRKSIKENNTFNKTSKKASETLSNIVEKIKSFTSSDRFSNFFKTVGNGVSNFVNKIKEKFISIGSSLFEAFKNGDIDAAINILNGVLFSGVILKIQKFIKDLSSNIKKETDSLFNPLKDISDNFSNALKSLTDCLDAMQKSIKVNVILKIAAAIGILALSIIAISGIDENKINASLGAITTLFIELSASMAMINKISSNKKGAGTIIAVAVAIRILASALKTLSDLNSEQIEKGVLGVAGLATVLVGSMKLLSAKGSPKGVAKCAVGMILFSAAIKILASICEDFANMEWEDIGKGLAGVGGLLAEIDLFLKTAKFGGKAISTAIGIVLIASAIKILETSCGTFASMSWEDIGKGLAGVGGLLTEVALFTKLTGNTKKLISAAIGITIMSFSLKTLTNELKEVAKLSWEEIARGLVGIGGAIAILITAAKTFPKKDMMELSMSLPVITSALVPLAKGLTEIAEISWLDLAKALIGLGVTMAILSKSLDSMDKTLKSSGSLFIAATAIFVLAGAIKVLSSIGLVPAIISLGILAGTMLTLGVAAKFIAPLSGPLLKLSGSIISLGISFTVLGAGLAVIGVGLTSILTLFVGTILTLQFIKWTDILKGLAAFASIFAIIGVAAALLRPLTTSILLLSVSMLSLGVTCISVALAIYLIVNALAVLAKMGPDAAASAVKALKEILIGLVDMLPSLLKSLFVTIKELVLGVIDVIVQCVPQLADGLCKTILGVLDALTKYGPSIIDRLLTLIIDIINGIAVRLPDLVRAVFNLLMSLFDGVVKALSNVDFNALINGIAGVGLIAGVMWALASVASLTPMAMVGVLGMGAVLAELALVFAALGGIAQIQGLDWLINEGGKLMQSIGKALGGFIGGIVGGIMEGVSSALPQLGTDLSDFMKNVTPFIDGSKNIDQSSLEGVKSLVDVILALTAANVLESITSCLTGGSSISDFADQLVPFGEAMAEFSSTVSGNIDQKAVEAAANAGKTMVAFQNTLPGTGGVVQWFMGEKDLGGFSEQLVAFGDAIVNFSSTVAGNINQEAVTAAANAGKTMVEFQNTLPNTGGVVQWFTGEQNMELFGTQLVSFGKSIADFSSAVTGNINEDAITAAANAGKTMVEFQNTLPNTGGVVQWFTGEQNMELFGTRLVSFGKSIVDFSTTVAGNVDEEAVIAAANAGKTMSELQSTLPNTGGVVQFFTGQQDLSSFGMQLALFGRGIAAFSDEIAGKMDPMAATAAAISGKMMADLQSTLPNTGGVIQFFTGQQDLGSFGLQLGAFGEGIAAFSTAVSGKIDPLSTIAAANAGKTLAEMTNSIPNEGGIGAWFAGEKSISNFGNQLGLLGAGIAAFSMAVSGNIDPESVTAAANAGKTLAEMTNSIPNEGGIGAWFAGEKNLSKFGIQLGLLGSGIAMFAANIGATDMSKVPAGVEACKTLAEMTNSIPNEGGIGAWFAGEKNLSKFSTEIGNVGTGIKDFATNLGEVDPETVKAGAEAGKKLAEMTNTIPNQGGIGSWFGGEKSLSNFSAELGSLGTGLNDFATNLGDIKPETVKAGAEAGKILAEMTNAAPDDSSKLISLGTNIKEFGSSLGSYFTSIGTVSKDSIDAASNVIASVKNVQSIDSTKLSNAAEALDKTVSMLKGMSGISEDSTSGFTKSISTLGKTTMDAFIDAFGDINQEMTNIGKNAIKAFTDAISNVYDNLTKSGKTAVDKFIDGANDKKKSALEAFKKICSSCSDAINDCKEDIKTAGNNLGDGLVSGINAKQQAVYNAGYALGQKAVQGEKDGQASNSPSKLTIKAGKWLGEGLVVGMKKMSKKVYNAGHDLGDYTVTSISSAVSKVSSLIDSGMDSEPTIRPVLDLSDVEAGANSINGLFRNKPSIGVMSNVNAINSMMNQRNQNGTTEDVVSAIDKLRKEIGTTGNSYSVNGITYNESSDVSDAIKTIVRAARVERRV